jgi:transcriptional regulator with XRE-family HTH domain
MIINKKFEPISVFLKNARIKSGLSQSDLSQRLGYTSPQIVSNWERGMCGAPLDKLYELVSLLNINKNELVERLLSEQEIILRSKIHGSKASKSRKTTRS